MNTPTFHLAITLAFLLFLGPRAQADVVSHSTYNARGLAGFTGEDPNSDYMGVITSTSPIAVQTDTGTAVVDFLHAAAPKIGDVVGRDLVSVGNRFTPSRSTWSYLLELPESAESGFSDLSATGELHFANTSYSNRDWINFEVLVNGASHSSRRIGGIDGGGSENLDLIAAAGLPENVQSVEVVVTTGLFNGEQKSFFVSGFNISGNYVQSIPEPGTFVPLVAGLSFLLPRRRK